MNRNTLNYIVDVGLLLSFIVSLTTGIFKWPAWTGFFISVYRVIPAVYLSKIHDISGLIMGGLVLIHIILHWGWIVTMTKKIFGKKSKK